MKNKSWLIEVEVAACFMAVVLIVFTLMAHHLMTKNMDALQTRTYQDHLK